MPFLPIATRELRQAARRPRTYWSRVGAGAIAAVCILGLLSPSFRGFATPAETGRLLFTVLAWGAFAGCVIAGAYLTSDCLCEEKREGTLGLLFLTDLRGYDVVFGKLTAKGLNPLYSLLGILPLLALPIMIGGVMAGEFWRTALVLCNTLFFSIALGLAVSAVSRHGRQAWLLTVALVLLLTLGPWLPAIKALGSPATLSSPSLSISPALAMALAFDDTYATGSPLFWFSSCWIHAFAWLLLAFASYVLPRAWQERPPNPRQERIKMKIREWMLGTPAQQVKARLKWLTINPVLWLAFRERHRRAIFWGFIGAFVGLWSIGYLFLESIWVQPETVFIVATLLHTGMKVWIALEVSRRLADEKRAGVLELLLVTPITIQEILEGLLAAIKRQFLVPILIVVGIDVLLAVFGFNGPNRMSGASTLLMVFLACVGMFAADSYALTWVGLWQGLSAKSSSRAFMNSLLWVLIVPWVLFCVCGAVVAGLSGGSAGALVFTWFGIGYFADLILCGRAMGQLSSKFRLAAGQLEGANASVAAHHTAATPAVPANVATNLSPTP